MAKNYDSTDLVFTTRGDYACFNGDLASSEEDPLRSLYQEILTRVKSSLGDWEMYPSLGASLEDFIGEPNNKITAEAMKIRMTASLAKDGFLNTSDLNIQYIPVDDDRILFRISVKIAPTAINNNSTSLGIRVLYNYKENNVFVTH